MSLAFFSDVHLFEYKNDSKRYDAFVASLESLADKNIKHVVLLGDIIDVFIGNFKFWHREHEKLFQALKRLTENNIEVIWFEGNHDFHFEKIANFYGVKVLDGEHTLNLEGKNIFLAHGDLVDQTDTKYLKWRATTRSKFFRAWVNTIPNFTTDFFYNLSRKISSSSRKKNKNYNQEKYKNMFLDFAKNELENSPSLDAIFLGHSHVQEFSENEKKYYINLGFWGENSGRYCLWTKDSSKPEIIEVVY